MANQRSWEDLQKYLLNQGGLSGQDAAGLGGLTGADSRETVQALAQQLTTLAQGAGRGAASSSSILQTSTSANRSNPAGSLAADLGKASGSFFLKGLTLAPLVRGLFSLFRRDNESEVIEPMRFRLPTALRTEAGLAPDGQTVSIDRGAGDRIRAIRPAESLPPNGDTGRATTGLPVQHITVQVQAMDSRSFLDHSEDIARAVRDAMLHSHSINDVVNDL